MRRVSLDPTLSFWRGSNHFPPAAAKHAAFVKARGRHYSNEAEAMKVRTLHHSLEGGCSKPFVSAGTPTHRGRRGDFQRRQGRGRYPDGRTPVAFKDKRGETWGLTLSSPGDLLPFNSPHPSRSALSATHSRINLSYRRIFFSSSFPDPALTAPRCCCTTFYRRWRFFFFLYPLTLVIGEELRSRTRSNVAPTSCLF